MSASPPFSHYERSGPSLSSQRAQAHHRERHVLAARRGFSEGFSPPGKQVVYFLLMSYCEVRNCPFYTLNPPKLSYLVGQGHRCMEPPQRQTPPASPPRPPDARERESPSTAPLVAVVFQEHRHESGVWSPSPVMPPHTGEGEGCGLSKRQRMHRIRKTERGKIIGDHEKRQEFLSSLADVSNRGTSGRESGPRPCRGRVYAHACPTDQGGHAAV